MTEKQAAFVREYLVDLNAAQAAARAGYSKRTARVIGSRLLRNAAVAEAVREAMALRAERANLTRDRVLEQYARLAFFDVRTLYDENGILKPVHEFDEGAAVAVAGIETLEKPAKDGTVRGVVRKVKLLDRRAALAYIGKHLSPPASGDGRPGQEQPPGLTVILHKTGDQPVILHKTGDQPAVPHGNDDQPA